VTTHPTQGLADAFSALTCDDIPPAIRERVVGILLDTVASTIAGCRGDEAAQVEALADALGGPRRSTVIAGPPARSPARRSSTATRSPPSPSSTSAAPPSATSRPR
jgi:2-methylcitrate dehydratase PrpD